MGSDKQGTSAGHDAADQSDAAPGGLIGHIYDVAIAPERIHALVSFWTVQIEKISTQIGDGNCPTGLITDISNRADG